LKTTIAAGEDAEAVTPPPVTAETPPPAVLEPAPVLSTEVLTPRPRDIVHPGQELVPEEHRRPWVKAGVAAAAGLAVLRILRSRR
jgi:hypothetical protein